MGTVYLFIFRDRILDKFIYEFRLTFYYHGAGPSRKSRFAALFLENRPRKNLLFLLFRPLLLFFEGLFRVEIDKLEQNRADQLFYR